MRIMLVPFYFDWEPRIGKRIDYPHVFLTCQPLGLAKARIPR